MAVLILLLSALTPWLSRRYSPKWLYGTWLVVALGLLVPFRFHLLHAPIRISALSSSLQGAVALTPGHAALPAVPSGLAVPSPAVPIFSFSPFLVLVWALGSAFFLLKTLWKHHRFLAMVRHWGKEVRDPQVRAILQQSREETGISGEVRLLVCPWIASPMMTGFFRPTILLPGGDLSPQGLALVLRHELIHWKRRDLWCKGLVLLVTAFHWFNPPVFLMGREVDTWCEISCDAEVMQGRSPEERQCYSETILQTAGRRVSFPTALSTGFSGGKRALKIRLGFILEIPARTGKKAGVLPLCLVLMGILGTGMLIVTPGKAEALASSLLSAWKSEQKSTASEEEKIHSTVDTYFSVGYADRESSSFVSRAVLVGTTASDISASQTWAQYVDASLKYDILCWQAQGYVPVSYSYAPHYDAVSTAEDGLTTTVTMEPVCELHFASRTTPDRVGSEKHVLTLQKQNSVWQIVGDDSDLDSVSYSPDADFQELTKTFPARFAAWKNEQAQLSGQAQAEASSLKQSGDPRFQLLDPQKRAQ